jgi:hypothetical protein
VNDNLSVEAGLRYELASPTYTMQNNIANFDPALYDPRRRRCSIRPARSSASAPTVIRA